MGGEILPHRPFNYIPDVESLVLCLGKVQSIYTSSTILECNVWYIYISEILTTLCCLFQLDKQLSIGILKWLNYSSFISDLPFSQGHDTLELYFRKPWMKVGIYLRHEFQFVVGKSPSGTQSSAIWINKFSCSSRLQIARRSPQELQEMEKAPIRQSCDFHALVINNLMHWLLNQADLLSIW